jgi:DeoR/GlpR family transcriptional regulator of sugar metabolism
VTSFERRRQLLELLHREPGLQVPELARCLGVSQGTVRNDLNALAQEKRLIRVRGGGVVLADSSSLTRNSAFAARLNTHLGAKQNIGRQAAQLIQDGDALLLDASSTVYHMAQFLRDRRELRIITNGLEVARLLAQNPTHTVNVVGGIFRPGPESLVGPWSERFLNDIRIKTAFVSCSGFTPEGGMTEVDVYEAHFRVKAVEGAQRVVALIDSSKFGKIDLTASLRSEQISTLFTDDGLAPGQIAQLEAGRIPHVLCGQGDS